MSAKGRKELLGMALLAVAGIGYFTATGFPRVDEDGKGGDRGGPEIPGAAVGE